MKLSFQSGNDVHLIETLTKGVSSESQTTQAIANAIDCSPQADGKIVLLKTTLLQLIEQGEVELVPSPLLTSVHGF